VPHRKDGEIRRSIVGALMVERLGAVRTFIRDFQVTPEQTPLSTGRTPAKRTPPHCLEDRALGLFAVHRNISKRHV
jgi:hypothetical protein